MMIQPDLHDRLAALNADILSEVVADLPDILDRQTPQDDSLATYARTACRSRA